MKLYDQVTSGQPSPGFGTAGRWQVTGTGRPENLVTRHVSRVTGFTMVEIAICLAIIGIALVAIIGVLPIGINVQRDNREETLIDQDATVLLENIRNGARGLDDLTNYVYAITNYWTEYTAAGKVGGAPVHINGYTAAGAFIGPGYSSSVGLPLTNGVNIIGLLSTPEYTDPNFGTPLGNIVNVSYISNYVVAYVHSLSGPAVEKPPQDNAILVGDSFGYKLICGNVPVAVDTNAFVSPNIFAQLYASNLTANLRELRLTFLWPLLPNGSPGNGRQTFRTTVAGQLVPTNVVANNMLYFFQPQFFTNAP
jgi:prepilin-type N-terminal cleavage/methylation domain-containing protein